MVTFLICVILGVGIYSLLKKTGKINFEEDEIKCNGLTMKEKESSDKFRKGLLFVIAITKNPILMPANVEDQLLSFATEFSEIIYQHACDRLKKYNSISSQDKTGLMYSLRDIIGEDMEQNIMNARNEKQIDEYFEELIVSTVKMLKKM